MIHLNNIVIHNVIPFIREIGKPGIQRSRHVVVQQKRLYSPTRFMTTLFKNNITKSRPRGFVFRFFSDASF